jgi:hypothetical protein
MTEILSMNPRNFCLGLTILLLGAPGAFALERPDTTFKIFQFPANMIPRIDGNADDWSIVPDDYIIGTDQLGTDTAGPRRQPDPKSLDVKVKVGWVKGLNRLYFLYEAYDDYWDFSRTGLDQDIFELVVDGDRSGGPLIERFHPEINPATTRPARAGSPPPATQETSTAQFISNRDAWFDFQGHHAQNYHIFTPAEGKDWCMAWGPQAAWIKKLPWSNVAYNYNFKPGESGKLIMEFWITPFDYAGAEGPQRAVESELTENKILGMSWAVLDYDDVKTNVHGFWNLSPMHTMYGQASGLCAFKLMPLEPKLAKPIDAEWSFKILDLDRRVVAFEDQSTGRVTSWKWDFGDGTTSDDQHPTHTYARTGQFIVVLNIEGPGGKSRRAKVWDVTLK